MPGAKFPKIPVSSLVKAKICRFWAEFEDFLPEIKLFAVKFADPDFGRDFSCAASAQLCGLLFQDSSASFHSSCDWRRKMIVIFPLFLNGSGLSGRETVWVF